MKKFLVSTSLALWLFSSLAQNNYQEGLDFFKKNDRQNAIVKLKAAIDNNEETANAHLLLSLIYSQNENRPEAIKQFGEFYEKTDQPLGYIYAMLFGGFGSIHSKKEKPELKLLEKIAKDPHSDGTTKAIVDYLLGYHYRMSNEEKKSQEHFKKIGAIDHWQIVGEFENRSGSGFNKDFGVISCPKADCTFKNKVDADVKWFRTNTLNFTQWLDFEYHFLTTNSIVYGQTFITNEVDREAFFRVGVSGSMKLWIDDQLVGSIPEERNCHMDVYSYKLNLPKGNHRILIQIGSSEINNSNLLLRITDAKGFPLIGITSSDEYRAYAPRTDYKVTTLSHYAENYFEDKLKSNPNDLLSLIMLGHTYTLNQKMHEARKTLKKARELTPDNTYVAQLLLSVYSQEQNGTEYKKEVDRIKQKDPNSIFSLSLEINDLMKKSNYEEAEKKTDQIIALYGPILTAEALKLSILSKKSSYDALIKEIDRLYTKYPDNIDIVNGKYQIDMAVYKSTTAGNAIFEKFIQNNYSYSIYTQLGKNYISQGLYKKGYSYYQHIIDINPNSVGTYSDLSEIYFSNKEYALALENINKVLEISPYIDSYWNTKARILQSMERRNEAIDAYKKSIYYNPSNYAARQAIRFLENKKDLFEYFEKYNADDLFKQSPTAENYPEDNSIILIDDEQRIFYPEGASEVKTTILVKVFNQTGVDVWKEQSVGYNPYSQSLVIETAEVLKADGSKIKAETHGGEVVFTGLEAGDAIYLVYRVENYSSGKLAKHFSDKFYFNSFFPTQNGRYSLLLPKTKAFKDTLINGTVQRERKEIEDYFLYTWYVKDQPSIKGEILMPELTDAGIVLEVSSIPDWDFIAQWYTDLSEGKAKADFDVKETVETILKGKENLSSVQKAELIYNYIVSNITYSSVSFLHGAFIPQKAVTTLNSKMGDCKDVSTLFVTMAKEAGINANLVLVDTRDNGRQAMLLPSMRFNHCIAELDENNEKYYIEMTTQKASFKTVAGGINQSQILRIPKSGTNEKANIDVLNSKIRVANKITRSGKVTFIGNDILVEKHSVRYGDKATDTRIQYADMGKEKQEKDMQQAISSGFSTPLKLNSLEFKDLKNNIDSVSYNFKYQASNHLTDFTGIKIFTLPWSDDYNLNEYFALEKRTYPFLLWRLLNLDSEEEKLEIQFPANSKVVELPKDQEIACKDAAFFIHYKLEGNVLKVEKKLTLLDDIISPEDYTNTRNFFIKMRELHTQKIGFKVAN